MEDDEQLRQALEESLRTARAEEVHRASDTEAVVPTAPALPASEPGSQTTSEFERQRQEAIERQKARWHQLHGQQVQEYRTPQSQQPTSSNQPGAGSFYPPVPAYEVPAGPRAAGSLYPSIPGHSSDGVAAVSQDSDLYPSLQGQQTQPAADPYLEELRRKQQQEEEDHRLAMQLAEQYSSEDLEEEQMHSDDLAAAAAAGTAAPGFGPGLYPSSGEDNDWQQVDRTPSMQHAAATAGEGAASNRPSDRVGGGGSYSSRPSSDAAAAAGSTAGGLLGAGLSALLAMAASAAARSAQHQQQDGASAHASATGGQQHHASSSSSGSDSRQQHSAADGTGGGSAAAAATGRGSGNSSGVQGLLGVAANALWNYMRGRNSSSSSSTATASTSSSSERHQQQQHGSDNQEAVMLQQMMRQLMMGNSPNYQQAASGSNSRGPGQGMGGVRVVNLPGGGFAASYSSGGNRHQQSGTATHDQFGPYMDPAEDLITQLLLAGARSAHSNRSQGVNYHEPGFTHYDPATGSSRFETSDQVFGPGFMGPGFRQVPDQGLEALLGALFGGQGFGREGMGNMRYEDLVNLDTVNVSTPEDVLGQLPRSKYVEGRKPGDSDTCVICQTQYSPGDSLIHLPCLHAYHEDCIKPWLQGHSKKCPVCKTDVC